MKARLGWFRILVSIFILGLLTITPNSTVHSQSGVGNLSRYTDMRFGTKLSYPSDWIAEIVINRCGAVPPNVITERIKFYQEDRPETAILVDTWDNPERLKLTEWFDRYERHLYLNNTVVLEVAQSETRQPALLLHEPTSALAHGRLVALVQIDNTITRVDYYVNDQGQSQEAFKIIAGSLLQIEIAGYTERLKFIDEFAPDDVLVQTCCDYTDPNTNSYPCDGGNCTWWAKYKRPDVGNAWGNALSWRDRARQEFGIGYVGYRACAGAIAVFQPGEQGADSTYGHVAYVESVGTEGEFSTSNMGWQMGCSYDGDGVWIASKTETGTESLTFIYNSDGGCQCCGCLPGTCCASGLKISIDTDRSCQTLDQNALTTSHLVWPATTKSPPSEKAPPLPIAPTATTTPPPDTKPPAPSSRHVDADTGNSKWQGMVQVSISWLPGFDREGPLAGYVITWDQDPTTDSGSTISLSPDATNADSPRLSTGAWYAHLRAVDQAGNASEPVHFGPFLIDASPPSFHLEMPTESMWTADPRPPSFTWPQAHDDGTLTGYYVYWGEDVTGTGDRLVAVSNHQPDERLQPDRAAVRYLRVAAVDAAENRSGWQTVAIWHYDPLPPYGALGTDGARSVVQMLRVTFNLDATDPGGRVRQMRFSSDGLNWGPWEPYTPRRSWQLANSPSPQTIYAQVKDEAGNLSQPMQTTVTAVLDVELPSSASYSIIRSVTGMGGGTKVSASYRVQGTSGQLSGTGVRSSSSYRVSSGYWAGLTCPLAELAAAPEVSVDGSIVTLTWDAVAGANAYNVYRGAEPYFSLAAPYDSTTGTTWADPNGAGDPLVNHTYVVRAANACGESGTLYRVGEFDYVLTPGN